MDSVASLSSCRLQPCGHAVTSSDYQNFERTGFEALTVSNGNPRYELDRPCKWQIILTETRLTSTSGQALSRSST